MRYINNGGETLLVQGVLKEPPRETNVQTEYIQVSESVDPQTKERIRPPQLSTVHKNSVVSF
jgi:hypothetical protein